MHAHTVTVVHSALDTDCTAGNYQWKINPLFDMCLFIAFEF